MSGPLVGMVLMLFHLAQSDTDSTQGIFQVVFLEELQMINNLVMVPALFTFYDDGSLLHGPWIDQALVSFSTHVASEFQVLRSSRRSRSSTFDGTGAAFLQRYVCWTTTLSIEHHAHGVRRSQSTKRARLRLFVQFS